MSTRCSGARLDLASHIPPRGSHQFTVRIEPVNHGISQCGHPYPAWEVSRRQRLRPSSTPTWRARSPRCVSSDPSFHGCAHLHRRAVRPAHHRPTAPRDRVVLRRWSAVVHDRSSGATPLLTSWMLLPRRPGRARHPADASRDRQGRRVDPTTEEEPGRILHEIRSGLLADAASPAPTPSTTARVDATPLFVMLVGELHRRWGTPPADLDPAAAPRPTARSTGSTEYGDRRRGRVRRVRAGHRPHGLVNQGWKDSFDGVNVRRRARWPQAPIALAEVQGYVYARATRRGPSSPKRSATTSAPRTGPSRPRR